MNSSVINSLGDIVRKFKPIRALSNAMARTRNRIACTSWKKRSFWADGHTLGELHHCDHKVAGGTCLSFQASVSRFIDIEILCHLFYILLDKGRISAFGGNEAGVCLQPPVIRGAGLSVRLLHIHLRDFGIMPDHIQTAMPKQRLQSKNVPARP
jgi:hypothetical protein